MQSVKSTMQYEYYGTNPDIEKWQWKDIKWFKDLPKNTFFAFCTSHSQDLPMGYSLYVVLFCDEPVDINWLQTQIDNIKDAPVILLNDGHIYDFPLSSNFYFYSFTSWHYHIDNIIGFFPEKKPRNEIYKASAVCHRITLSKLLVTTSLLETFNRNDILVKLSDWLELKNVNYKEPTNINQLDKIIKLFYEKYYGNNIAVDNFTEKDNYFPKNCDPWQPFFVNSALHFTNESYNYSQMNHNGKYCNFPGPDLTEKTFKCLISGTPFIAVGQFDTYKILKNLGFKFDYGSLDLSWDNDSGNFTRLQGILDLIATLKNYTITDIQNFTKDSTNHNTDHIWSGDFYKLCTSKNEKTADIILKKFK